MDEAARYIMQLAFVALSVWGLTNGSITHSILRKRSRDSPIIRALYRTNLALTLNAACFLLLIAQAFIWPTLSEPTSPLWVQFLGALAFLGAHFGLGFAQHNMRSMLTSDLMERAGET